MGKVFFVADIHFNDEMVFNSTCRHKVFKDIETFNEVIRTNWNDTVSDLDEVFVLGDVGKGSKEELTEYIESLSGHKYLIMGNHDRQISNDIRFWLDVGFEDVCRHPIIYNDFYMLSHEPMFVNENQPKVNIFGHVHDCCSYKTVSSRSFCVCLERISYAPVEFKTVKSLIETEDSDR